MSGQNCQVKLKIPLEKGTGCATFNKATDLETKSSNSKRFLLFCSCTAEAMKIFQCSFVPKVTNCQQERERHQKGTGPELLLNPSAALALSSEPHSPGGELCHLP